jgi:DNA-binding Lrp family transcriptional regulator
MLSKKDAQIISHLRNNSRKKITDISRETGIPVTTIYDKVRMHNKHFVKKHTTLLDFPSMGLHAKAHISIKVKKSSKDELQKFLLQHPNVNSLSKIGFESDFLAEVIFKDSGEVENFVENIDRNYQINKIQIFNVVDELKKESFLTDSEHFEVIR